MAGKTKLKEVNFEPDTEDLETHAALKEETPKEKPKLVLPPPIITVPEVGQVPISDPTYVPCGAYQDVKTIIDSEIFIPVFLTGPTRSGKTMIPLQICSEKGKHLYRVNITEETDESDLLGRYVLIDGNTIWEDGPAVLAAQDKTGAILLLDEIDLGSSKLLCLQPLLEGNGIYLKKANRWIRPAPGFNIVATANTKGKGNEDGRYIGARVMNSAMLERFPLMYTHDYTDKKTEAIILKKNLHRFSIDNPDFIEKLCQWADNIRKTKAAGGIDETISTGRLVYIIQTYVIFGRNRLKAIRDNINAFDLNTQTSFLDMYTKIDANAIDGDDSIDPSTLPKPKKKAW